MLMSAFDLAVDLAVAVKALLHPIFLGGSQNWRASSAVLVGGAFDFRCGCCFSLLMLL